MTSFTATEVPSHDRSRSRKELIASTVGSIVESFDWNIYAVLAPFFAASVFGGGSGKLLAAYAGFAVGFLARPVGSALIGRFSDRYGRRRGLTLSMSLIAIASLGIALLPSSSTIGIWAGILAVLLRLVQGLAYGGETPTVAAYVTEAAPAHARWRFSAISYGGIVIGSLLGFGTIAAMFAIMGKQGVTDGGWRWGFVVAAALGLFAIWVRTFAPETETFEKMQSEHGSQRPPVSQVFRENAWSCVTLSLFMLSGTVPFYFCLVYMPVYVDNVGAGSKETATSFMSLVLVALIAAMYLSGWIADKVGPLPVLRLGYVLQILLTLPLLLGMAAGVVPWWLTAVVLGVLAAPVLASHNLMNGLLFPPAVRAVGAGIVGATTVAVFGGTFPMLAEWLHERNLYGVLPYYIAAIAVLGLICTVTATRSRVFMTALGAVSAPVAKEPVR